MRLETMQLKQQMKTRNQVKIIKHQSQMHTSHCLATASKHRHKPKHTTCHEKNIYRRTPTCQSEGCMFISRRVTNLRCGDNRHISTLP